MGRGSWPRYVALGDSLTAGRDDLGPEGTRIGWARRLAGMLGERTGVPCALADLARDGASVEAVLAWQLPSLEPATAVEAWRPDLVSVTVGMNDIRDPEFEPGRFAVAVGTLLDGLAGTGATVLTCTLPDIAGMLPLPVGLVEVARQRLRQASDVIREEAARRDAICLDLWMMAGAADPGLFGTDRIHPNTRGHQLIADAFAALLFSGTPGATRLRYYSCRRTYGWRPDDSGSLQWCSACSAWSSRPSWCSPRNGLAAAVFHQLPGGRWLSLIRVDMLRIGTLGTSRISHAALIDPATDVAGVTVAAVAARDAARAEHYALRHGIAKAYGSYQDLLDDPDIDAVYNPLPNSLHGPWTLRAIAAGKHVLCEKPFTQNAAEAAQVVQAAEDSGLVVMEAMHYRYHPLTARLREVVDGLGPVRHLQCWTSFSIADPADIRYDFALGGGALMDGGCYAIDVLRLLGASDGQSEPSVTAALADPVTEEADGKAADRSLAVRLAFPGGATGWFDSTFTRDGEFRADLHVICEDGVAHLDNFIFAWEGRLRATRGGTVVADETGGGDTTYVYQLRAFAAAIAGGAPVPTSAASAAVTMRIIDDAYRAAGLAVRPADARA